MITPNDNDDSSKSPTVVDVASLHYPRTGKRGVPQQFARRLYEMLQCETKLMESDEQHPRIIFWSKSGKAFRIADVADFSTTILPKYFRTKKFSSFQRNLNLYGFSKVRRGPETDMYAHPSFVRDQPESLSQLRKLASTAGRRRERDSSTAGLAKNKKTTTTAAQKMVRSVSPSTSPHQQHELQQDESIPPPLAIARYHSYPPVPLSTSASGYPYTSQRQASYATTATWNLPTAMSKTSSPPHPVPSSPERNTFNSRWETGGLPKVPTTMGGTKKVTKRPSEDRGRLDLLAMAMEQAAATVH